MELLDKLTQLADKYDMLPPGSLILAAVSGGADSMCLLAALLELAEKRDFSVAVAHFNHMLRGAESDRDAAFVETFCEEKGIKLYLGSGDVRVKAERRHLGIEETARILRYAFFRETAEKTGAGRIATAHTADDNAETLLLNLVRGAGLKGLGGIPPVRGEIVRPMLTVTRREVLEFLDSRSVPYVEDSTNGLDIYSRNIIRHRVIPVLTELNPRFAESAAAASALLREDEEFLNGLAAEFIKAHAVGKTLEAYELAALPRPVGNRVVRLMGGPGLTAGHVEAVLKLCVSEDPSGEVSLPGTTAKREYDRIVFYGATAAGAFDGASASAFAGASASAFAPVELPVDGRLELPVLGLTVSCIKSVCETIYLEKINKSFTTFLFNYDNICGKIVIRPRETGDKIELFGGNGTKSLKKLFIEKRVPVRRRPFVPVIADETGVLAVLGIGFDKRAACKPGDTTLEISFKETAREYEK